MICVICAQCFLKTVFVNYIFISFLTNHFVILQIFWLMILGTWHCTGEKLSPDQKAPLFARGSGGLILNTPFEDNKARNRPISNVNAPVDNVQKEETEMLKLVDGELVRTVKGSLSYNSPEGLPISIKWAAIFYPYRFIFFNKIFFLLCISFKIRGWWKWK